MTQQAKDSGSAKMYLGARDNLAEYYMRQGQLDKAEATAQETLDLKAKGRQTQRAFNTGASLDSLAKIKDLQGDHAAANDLYRQGVEQRANNLPPGERSTIEAMDRLSQRLAAQSSFAEAAQLSARALEATVGTGRASGPDPERLVRLADLQTKAGKPAEAKATLSRLPQAKANSAPASFAYEPRSSTDNEPLSPYGTVLAPYEFVLRGVRW